jgi:hypothetical protein
VKIVINTDDSCKDIEVAITCNRLTLDIEKMVALLRMLDMQLTGLKGGETFLIDSTRVLYIDTVEKKTLERLYLGLLVITAELKWFNF